MFNGVLCIHLYLLLLLLSVSGAGWRTNVLFAFGRLLNSMVPHLFFLFASAVGSSSPLLAAIYFVCVCVCVGAKQQNATFNLLGIALHWWFPSVCPYLWLLNKELTSLLAIRTEISFYKYVSNGRQWNAIQARALARSQHICWSFFIRARIISISNWMCVCMSFIRHISFFFACFIPAIDVCECVGGCEYFCTKICVCFHFLNYLSLHVMKMSQIQR